MYNHKSLHMNIKKFSIHCHHIVICRHLHIYSAYDNPHTSDALLSLKESGKLLRCTQQLPIELLYCYCTIALVIAILLL